MLRLQSLTALCLRTALAKRVPAIASTSSYRAYSKDNDSDSDDEKSHKKSKKPKAADKKQQQQQQQQEKPAVAAANAGGEEESAATRLNKLLASMQTDDKLSLGRNVPKIAKPGEANKKRKEAVKHEAASKDIFAAAKNVAAMLNGDNAGEETKKQTESELLAKLLGHKPEGEAAGSAQQTEQAEELSLSDLIVGMKIDRRQQPKVQTRADYVRRSLNGKPQQQQQQQHYDNIAPNRRMRKQQPREAESYTGSVNLFGGEPLGIFKDTAQLKESTDILSTWQHLQNVELQLQVTHPPANYYEKIALWTEQGKVWRFPIDNEQDYAEERDVDFSEHIFLEQHLEDWCPSKGPIRHFMELVCVGLSKNPYITARDKKEHILWYRDYFMAKRDILKDLIDKEKMDKISKNKASSSQLEA